MITLFVRLYIRKSCNIIVLPYIVLFVSVWTPYWMVLPQHIWFFTEIIYFLIFFLSFFFFLSDLAFFLEVIQKRACMRRFISIWINRKTENFVSVDTELLNSVCFGFEFAYFFASLIFFFTWWKLNNTYKKQDIFIDMYLWHVIYGEL